MVLVRLKMRKAEAHGVASFSRGFKITDEFTHVACEFKKHHRCF
jgi:hypothetical protein